MNKDKYKASSKAKANTLEKLKNIDSAEAEFRKKALQKLIDSNFEEMQKLKSIAKST